MLNKALDNILFESYVNSLLESYNTVCAELTKSNNEIDALNSNMDEIFFVLDELDDESNCQMCTKRHASDEHDKNCKLHSVVSNYSRKNQSNHRANPVVKR
jgi:hypothetical protein